MANEPKIIFEAPGCPNPSCDHNKVTVSQLGCEDIKKRGKVAEDAFTKLGLDVVPIEQPMVAGLTVTAIASSWDICSICGTRYYTRAELLQIPVQGQIPPQGRPGNFRMPPGPFGRG